MAPLYEGFEEAGDNALRNTVPYPNQTRAEAPPVPTLHDHPQFSSGLPFQTSQHGPDVPTRRQLSKQEWEQLKPTIQHLYMGEGGSLALVTKYLNTEYGFLPTKKQLTQRFQAWGFRKNVTRHVKKPALTRVSKVTKSASQVRDTKVSGSDDVKSGSRAALEPIHTEINRWPFADLDIDVVGSPGLSRLLYALELETSEEVPTLALPPPAFSTISGTDLPREDSRNNRLERYELINRPKVSNIGSTEKLEPAQLTTWDLWDPWDGQGNSFNLLSALPLHSSPLNEIDPFPTTNPHYTQNFIQSTNEEYVKGLLAAVAALHPEADPRWPQMMRSQADTCFDAKDFKQAETLYRKLLASFETTLGPDSIPVLDVSRKIAMGLFHLGKYQLAVDFYQPVHAKIIAQFPVAHAMVMDSISIMSELASYIADFSYEADLSRQLVQINLCHRGPRHKSTKKSLRRLGAALMNIGDSSQSEKLLHIVLQLFRSNVSQWQQSEKDEYGKALQNLCRNLFQQARYEECEIICQEARQQAKTLLGVTHDVTLNLDFRIARIWKQRGIRIPECEVLLRETLKQQMEFNKEIDAATMDTIQELAELLRTLGRHKEASGFYEQAFWGDLDTYGPDHGYTFYSFTELGASYDLEGRRDDTLLLAERYIERIVKSKGEQSDVISQIQKWIADRTEPQAAYENWG